MYVFFSLEGAYLNFVQCNFRRPFPEAWPIPEVAPTLSVLELRALRKLVCIDPVRESDIVTRLALLAELPELEELHIYLVLRYEVSGTRERRKCYD